MSQKVVIFQARDGYKLTGTIFLAEDKNSHKFLIIGPGTGIKQYFYFTFCEYLQQKGYNVLVFDYRGIGRSVPQSLRNFKAYLHEWGEKDLDAAISFVKNIDKNAEIYYLGHSVGGQILCFVNKENLALIRAIVFISSQSGYWKFWRFPKRYLYYILWKYVMPGLTLLFGYFPGKYLTLGSNL